MKVVIKAGSQEEFDAKREELIKAIAGTKFDVEIRPKGESKAIEERAPFYVSQEKILEEWDADFQETLRAIKHEIAEVIDSG